MAEVKEFGRRRKFTNFRVHKAEQANTLSKTNIASPLEPVVYASSNIVGTDDGASRKHVNPTTAVSRESMDVGTDDNGIPNMLLAIRPRKPSKVDGAVDTNTTGLLYSPHSVAVIRDMLLKQESPSSRSTAAVTVSKTLPPPFSMSPRVVSDEHAMPSGSNAVTRIVDAAGTPDRAAPERPLRSSSLIAQETPSESSPTTASRSRLLRSAVRFVESYVRSPGRGSVSPTNTQSPSSTQSPERSQLTEANPQEFGARFRIYNDSLPASAQPSTPQHLPEARHQGRLRGAYTAPVARWRQQPGLTASTVGGRDGRAASPSGLNTPGFRGLYGGVENADDLTLYQGASRPHGSQADHDGTHDGRH